MKIDPKEIPVPKLHSYLLGAVVPRPIALASTIDKEGRVNLSPFSFFNCFGSNPPILVFSPSRRGRDNTTKHTYENVLEVPEVCINIVNYAIVEQVSLASCEFPKGINEFEKSGLTPVASERIRPPRVKESPVSFECKVNQVIPMGTQGSAGNLVISEVLLMHVKDEVLDKDGRIDPVKLDAVARMGGDNYCRAQSPNIFTVPKPNEKLGIGFDRIPEHIRTSTVLTGNDLGRLGNVERLPDEATVISFADSDEYRKAAAGGLDSIHRFARELLRQGRVEDAWKALLASKPNK
jgi:flavin reductase (DIM6/NTAB) family NADH-FMN oxidoreductase RutF